MLALSSTGWVLMVLCAVVVGLTKTALPGAGTIAVGLAAAAMPAKESTGTLLVLLILGDLLAVASYRREVEWQTLRRMAPAVLVGLLLGTGYLHLASDTATRRVIGLVLLAMIAITLWRRHHEAPVPPVGSRAARLAGAGYGSMAGFTTMVANAAGPVTSLYFLSRGFQVTRFLGTTAWFYLVVNLVKLPLSAGIGVIRPETLWIDLVLAPVVVLSALAGRRLARRIPQRVFEPLVMVLTVLSAVNLLR
ncbi:sulfite exporter TauE/SafE family protein [Luteococcus peritonei]|uniref:Probable membrane transporter protein n=1 Tax=Luteococcus peritonei TaxID=88874 RepID=A0ABW4RUX9_9ACTN